MHSRFNHKKRLLHLINLVQVTGIIVFDSEVITEKNIAALESNMTADTPSQ